MTILKCKRLHESALLPERKTQGAAGYDLTWCAALDTIITPERIKLDFENQEVVGGVIQPWSSILLSTGLQLKIPDEHYGRIAPRSGLALKGVTVGAGVVDADYRGHVKVLLYTMESSVTLKKGDRIAQLILERISTPPVMEMDASEELSDTKRGDSGFGSTGMSG